MFGIQFLKVQPTTYLLQVVNGRVVREGAGLSFFYYAPTSSLVAVPLASTDVPFVFNEVTLDFQDVSVQGQVTYRITDPKKIAEQLNFTLNAAARGYASDDPQKLAQRVINTIKVLTRVELQQRALRDALKSSDVIVQNVRAALSESPSVAALGLEIQGLSILSIRPNPETMRALEAEAREQLLRESDQAIYNRRNAAVEQERAIKENELNTEIAVENKKRQIREAQMDAERAVQEKQHQLQQAEMASKILLEEQNKQLVALAVENAKSEADAKAYSMLAMMKAFAGVDAQVLHALAGVGMKPDQLVAQAFRGLAERADKIGELNISPDLLRDLLAAKPSE